MAWFVGQSLVVIVLAFILGVVVGRFSARFGNVSSDARQHTDNAPESDRDELQRIEGIDPAMAAALRTAGIRTIAQLADSDDDAMREAMRAAGLGFVPSLSTWSRQARLIADRDAETAAR
ncbi:putative flap endonuclease-1-like 5' DNA nuclease [Actinoplanes campanulatus]|uniref:Putative flap endonuclease-1-like 5' DNA nuclease n=1 Tax=Actinoplanes campanulatus TaxID=113559 RepID=A0A7W5AN22_9ACTN|nr:helix-hairpin-helix domain-containing protein [Actinoplanes campanulatus]MBB3099126.1 putative flap endonuclease-1-like 5' DNA nuclease [Actinoplanes campanulatus]